jgi:energy-coupling factor transport system ATP-binding protein
MVLDEPTSQLDAKSSAEIITILEELNREGITIVLGEHRLNRVVSAASRGIMLESGRVVFDGEPRDLIRKFPWLLMVRRGGTKILSNPGRENAIEVRDISFRYANGDWVLRNLSLELKKSELLGVFGENGSGKSTLARLIAGLLDGHEGEIRLDGRRSEELAKSDIARKIGIVFQDPNKHLFHDTVREEVGFARGQMGIPDNGEIDYLLARLHLTEFATRNPRDLSGGQKQKVAIASVMSYDPGILILDEPTRGLDLPEKAEIMRVLRRLVSERSISVMILTHDLDIIEAFGDRASVLRDGVISFEGDPGEAVRVMQEVG